MNLEAPHSFDGRKVGSPWSCDTKKYGINCQDSMIFSYEQEERERENSFLKCSDWLKLIQSFFWNVLSLEPWKFLGTFRQVNIKRGEEGVEAFRIKGEWQHLSAFAQKSILLQYIKWLQSYGKTYKLWYTIDLLVILRIGSQILFASVLSTNLAHWCGSEACLKSYPDDIGARNSLRKKTRALWELCPPPGKKTLDIDIDTDGLDLRTECPRTKTQIWDHFRSFDNDPFWGGSKVLSHCMVWRNADRMPQNHHMQWFWDLVRVLTTSFKGCLSELMTLRWTWSL